MKRCENGGTNQSWCILADIFCSSHVRVKGISAARWVDRATKSRVGTRVRENKNVVIRKVDLPNHPESTVARSLTEVPDGYRVKVVTSQKKTNDNFRLRC